MFKFTSTQELDRLISLLQGSALICGVLALVLGYFAFHFTNRRDALKDQQLQKQIEDSKRFQLQTLG